MSSDFREAQPRPIRADKDALSRAGNMGADGASPSKVFERRYRLAFGVTFFGGTTAVSSDFCGAKSRPHPD